MGIVTQMGIVRLLRDAIIEHEETGRICPQTIKELKEMI